MNAGGGTDDDETLGVTPAGVEGSDAAEGGVVPCAAGTSPLCLGETERPDRILGSPLPLGIRELVVMTPCGWFGSPLPDALGDNGLCLVLPLGDNGLILVSPGLLGFRTPSTAAPPGLPWWLPLGVAAGLGTLLPFGDAVCPVRVFMVTSSSMALLLIERSR